MKIFLDDHIAACDKHRVLVSYQGGINRVLTLRILCSVDEADEVAAVKITKSLHLVNRTDCGSKPSHDLRLQLEAQVHTLRSNVEKHVSRCCDCVAVPPPRLPLL